MIGVLILVIGEHHFAVNVGKVEENPEAVPGWLGEWGTEYNVYRGGEGHRHSMHTNPLLVQLSVPRRALEADRGQRLRLNPRAVPTRPMASHALNFLCLFLSFLI